MNTLNHTTRMNRTLLRAAVGLAVLLTLAGCAGKVVTGHATTGDRPAQAPAASTAGPTTNSPGLPNDWQARAISAATASLKTCAQANTLQPLNCPQQISWSGPTVLAVHWTALNVPLDHAVGVQQTSPSGAPIPGQVAVYGQYQMETSFTTSGQSRRPYRDYAAGIAQATMTWDGTSFQNVTFAPQPITQLPVGVMVPPFHRPTEVTDTAVLQAVQSGFHDCVSIKITPSTTTPANCPNAGPGLDPYFGNLHWALDSDPMQGALVSFDTSQGDFAVTGNFAMTLNAVRHVPGQPSEARTFKTATNYTATLAWDGHQLSLLKIAV
jgi:hypothetical protein